MMSDSEEVDWYSMAGFSWLAFGLDDPLAEEQKKLKGSETVFLSQLYKTPKTGNSRPTKHESLFVNSIVERETNRIRGTHESYQVLCRSLLDPTYKAADSQKTL